MHKLQSVRRRVSVDLWKRDSKMFEAQLRAQFSGDVEVLVTRSAIKCQGGLVYHEEEVMITRQPPADNF